MYDWQGDDEGYHLQFIILIQGMTGTSEGVDKIEIVLIIKKILIKVTLMVGMQPRVY